MTTKTKRVLEAIETRRVAIDAAIPEELPIAEPKRLYEASRHLLDAGGKRLRPVLLLLVAESLSDTQPGSYREFPDLHGQNVDVLAAAVSIEIIHLFTLIHDDIMDQDDLRRGVPAVHRAYDTETAILAGDTLYSKAFEVMLETGAPYGRTVRVLQRLANTCTEICEGQALDISFEKRAAVDIDEYLRMIELKTAVLYGAAASVPSILLGAPDATTRALYQYGIDVGKAFQIHDDVLDLISTSDTLGKRRGSDLIEGKKTLITAHANAHGVDVESIVPSGTDRNAEEHIDAAVAELNAAGSIEFASETARAFVDAGKEQLGVLPDNDPRDRLHEIADYLIERDY